jgi:hypothetical protein
MIPRDSLQRFHWYEGSGRFEGVPECAMWTGEHFVGLGFSFGEWTAEEADYGERGFEPTRAVMRRGGEPA